MSRSKVYEYMRSVFGRSTSASEQDFARQSDVSISTDPTLTKQKSKSLTSVFPSPPSGVVVTTSTRTYRTVKQDKNGTATSTGTVARPAMIETGGRPPHHDYNPQSNRCCTACVYVTMGIIAFGLAAAFTAIALYPGKDVYHVFMIWIGVFGFSAVYFMHRGCKVAAEINHWS